MLLYNRISKKNRNSERNGTMKKAIVRTVIFLLIAVITAGVLPLHAIGADIFDLFKPPSDPEPYDTGRVYSVGDVIEFGSYPQSRASAPSYSVVPGGAAPEYISYGYMNRGVPSNFMKYADVEYNGGKYRSVVIGEYRPPTASSSFDYSNEFQRLNGYPSRNIYWFKYEPLRWRVLDPEIGLVVCVNIIDSQAFTDFVYVKPYDSQDPASEYCFTDETCVEFSNYYGSAAIRNWLDGTFYNTAFSSAEQSLIKRTVRSNEVYNSTESYHSTYDRIFLASFNEISDPAYGFSCSSGADSERSAQPTEYAKSQGLRVIDEEGGEDLTAYYLRTPLGGDNKESTYRVVSIRSDGSVDASSVIGTCFGIRPAMIIDLGKVGSLPHDHRYERVVKEATYAEPGYSADVCAVCGAMTGVTEIPILVPETLLCDVDGDGVVTSKDVRALKQYLSGLLNDEDIVTANSDVNSDGVISAKDIRDLKRLLTG